MNKEILKSKWVQLRGSIRSKWGDFTDQEIEEIKGDYAKLVGLIQEKYGRSKEEAEKEIEKWH